MLDDNLARLPSSDSLIGNVSSERYIQDPQTGLLDEDVNFAQNVNGVKSKLVFNLAKKISFLSKFAQCFPDVMEACDDAGISHETYKNHLMIDPKFYELCRDIAMRKVYKVEAKSFEVAMLDKGVIDRMSIKRAFMPELYNPEHKIIISTPDRPSADNARERMKRLQGAVDAEIVKQSIDLADDRTNPHGQ